MKSYLNRGSDVTRLFTNFSFQQLAKCTQTLSKYFKKKEQIQIAKDSRSNF